MCACGRKAALSGSIKQKDGRRDGEMVAAKERVERKGKGDSLWASSPALRAALDTSTHKLKCIHYSIKAALVLCMRWIVLKLDRDLSTLIGRVSTALAERTARLGIPHLAGSCTVHRYYRGTK